MTLRLRIRCLARWTGIVAIVCLAGASAAQADGEWKIAKETMTELEATEASIFGTASENFRLSVSWYASEIECSTLATEAPTKIFKGGTSEAILKLSSCQVLGPPFVSETCKLIEPISLKVKGDLLLKSGKTYELFEAPTGKTSLGAIEFEEGTECSLPLSSELNGTFVGEMEAGERKEQPMTLSPAVESLFGGDSLSFGTHPATLKGKSVWALAAGYKGFEWAAEGKESKEEEEVKLEEEKKLMEEELACNRKSSEPGWYVCGSLLKEGEEAEIQAELEGSDGILLTTLFMTKVEILCTSLKYVGGKLQGVGRVTGKIHYAGCITKLNGVENKRCQPKSPGASLGLVETNALSGEIQLHEVSPGNDVAQVKVSPTTGSVLVKLEMGALCVLGSTFEVSGTFFAQDGNGEFEVESQTHVFEPASLSSISFGGSPATIDGSVGTFLDGAHLGEKFGGVPK